MSASLKVFRCGPGRNFAFTRRRWPALTNLGRRKPRGLGVVYGERGIAVDGDTADSAPQIFLSAFAAAISGGYFIE